MILVQLIHYGNYQRQCIVQICSQIEPSEVSGQHCEPAKRSFRFPCNTARLDFREVTQQWQRRIQNDHGCARISASVPGMKREVGHLNKH